MNNSRASRLRSDAIVVRNLANPTNNYMITPTSVVCPGILSKDIDKKWAALSSVKIQQRESIRSSRISKIFSQCKINASNSDNALYLNANQGTIEFHIKQVSLTDRGLERIKLTFPNQTPNIKVSWKFLTFDKTDVPLLGSSLGLYTVESSVIYKVNVNANLLDFLATQNFVLELYAWDSDKIKFLAKGELKLCEMLDYPCSNIEAIIELCDADKARLLSNTSIAIVYGAVSLWFHFNCDIDILTKATRTYNICATPIILRNKSSTLTCYRNADYRQFSVISKNTSLSLHFSEDQQDDIDSVTDPLEPTESETANFKEALDLVLIRNKALRTTQSEISNELYDRARWLHEESNWKRTLQEYAILSGEDPTTIEWRQWRTENTADISLRNYPSQMIIYKPEVTITIDFIKFHNSSNLVNSTKFKQFYVEYNFLTHDGIEMESDYGISDDKHKNKLYFKFAKTFCIDPIINKNDADKLASTVKNSEDIRFSVVGIPKNDPVNVPCAEEVTFCQLNIFQLLQGESNEFSSILSLSDPNDNLTELGYMKVQISGILAMRRLALQLLAPPEYNILQ